MKKYTNETIAELIKAAKSSPRKRSHLNIHNDLNDPVQRLLIALEPETYVCPHFHPEDYKTELLTLLKGSCLTVIYEEDGEVCDSMLLNPENPLVEFPPLTWHSLICLEAETVILEVKKRSLSATSTKVFCKMGTR